MAVAELKADIRVDPLTGLPVVGLKSILSITAESSLFSEPC